ncbi:hypothetical protein DRE_04488 [Drechslerella stenobrocha 248]|uniref:Uncharacterized protein n=1 Tax=Drechslerella stenobrocha 248 TaxID=1043628 RepID=W7I1B4_9PEZI|nr:hypothetical protein DRE_04488 [Drechslerella stenobrocha 248]
MAGSGSFAQRSATSDCTSTSLAYRCRQPSVGASPPPAAYMHLSREDLGPGGRHPSTVNVGAQLEGERVDAFVLCERQLTSHPASLKEDKAVVASPDGSNDEKISCRMSKLADALALGDWEAADKHWTTLVYALDILASPEVDVLEAMVQNSKADWHQAVKLLENYKHQSASEPELSARAYYARAVALYKLKDYETSHLIVQRYMEGPLREKYQSMFGDLASRTLEDLGDNLGDSTKTKFYKSLVPPDHVPDPILFVTSVSRDRPPELSDKSGDGGKSNKVTVPILSELSREERAALRADMKRLCLSFGPDRKILVYEPEDLFTALHHALQTDNLPLMTLICSNQCCAEEVLGTSPILFDLDPPMPQYAWRATTLLHVVAGSQSRYSAAMAQLLLDNGASTQRTLFEGITPLHVCARQTNAEVAAVLIRGGADIEARSITGKPPIHFAAWKASWNADVRILKMLITAGANINVKNIGGYTALHWCMFDGRSAAPIEILLKRPEIDRFVRAMNNKTPWDIFWEHEDELKLRGEPKRTQILYTLRRYGITR